MGFPRQEYWIGLPFPTSGDLPNPGTETQSLASAALADGFFTTESPGKPSPNCCRFLMIPDDLNLVTREVHVFIEKFFPEKRSGGFPGGSVVKNTPASAEDTGSIPDPRRSHKLQSALGPCSLSCGAAPDHCNQRRACTATKTQQSQKPIYIYFFNQSSLRHGCSQPVVSAWL